MYTRRGPYGKGECVYVIFERTSFDWFGAFRAHLIEPACGERKDKYNAQRVSVGGGGRRASARVPGAIISPPKGGTACVWVERLG